MSHPNIRLLDRAKETTTTTGSGTISLAGAVDGFVAISGIGVGNSTYYTLQEGNRNRHLWGYWKYAIPRRDFLKL